ncbi:MAG: aminotransferase class III-fold pyridoxal phosphate-dependent enzyme [Maribacter sp.]|uniref:aminotransferase class III-fold pyridoxal phosphate-dependent enzyme n=1 Tax=Maribacter sp. TaxID=1897614 RepID=UPI003C730864
MVDYSELKLSLEKAESLVLDLYNIAGKAVALPGELDFNFKIIPKQGACYILKVSRPDENLAYLDFQQKLLQHIEAQHTDIVAPKVIIDMHGNAISSYSDESGNHRNIRLLTYIPGRIWSSVNPQLDALQTSLGQQCGKLSTALLGFGHPLASRDFEWDIAQSLWTKDHVDRFKDNKREILTYFQNAFEHSFTAYSQLRKSVVHNDANDNNVLVSETLLSPKVIATIDYGDAIHTQIINDVAIACAYGIMHQNDPLQSALPILKGYHQSFPLTEVELKYLYVAIAMRLVISVTKSMLNKLKEPDNDYLLISERPAWELLEKWRKLSPHFAEYSFRNSCGYTAHPKEHKFKEWAAKNNVSLSGLFPTMRTNEIYPLDLSVSSTWIGHQSEFNDLDLFQFKIGQLQKANPSKIIAGGYLEPRPLYTSSAYDKIGNHGRESRTVHLGIDYWLPHNTPVHALFDGEVMIATNDAGEKEYGGLVVLKHTFNDLVFYTLYGHLSVASATAHAIGDKLKAGEQIGVLGNYPENGNWAPHLHFQILLSLLDYTKDFPGVAYQAQIEVWKSICPDPNLLFRSKVFNSISKPANDELIVFRKKHLGKSMSLQYKVPLKMVRGNGPYLIDQFGRRYLDTVNNVAHVGHEHPRVVMAGQQQMALLNTNSRYLHENINALAQELLETLPKALSVLHFVNSGSEANELAIRMAKAATGERDIIASEVGYHGNTNMCIDISSYKFDGKGGQGAPEHTHIFPLPDAFRGKYLGKDTGLLYAGEVQKQIEKVHKKGRGVGALIVEPIISCGGQIELPNGFLKQAYRYIRNAGGLCISDEVQVGCGRMGKTFWGFQLHDVLPDIITIGKPLGNGHPLAAVACTQEVAEKFANGMEYFNTFGGNPVSCAIGTVVLRVVKEEGLQNNALEVGDYLKSELNGLATKFPILGDIRGQGLFLGIELVDAALKPLAAQTDYLANRMKEYGILMSTDGPDHNVLKIKPPLVFTKENAKEVLYYLERILEEDFMKL